MTTTQAASSRGSAASGARIPAIPASFFGIVLGLVGLGDCWRVAHKAWDLPKVIGETVMITGFVMWVVLMLLYLAKWAWHRQEALAEWRHPVQSCFVGLSGVATILAGIAIAPYATTFATALFAIGAVVQLAYGVRFTSVLWMGGRDEATVSPALYLPTVAGNFVSAFGAGYFGYPELGVLFLGAGVLSWLALESMITHRLSAMASLPLPMRPAMGIMLAPPVVGCIGYLFVTGGLEGPPPDLVAAWVRGHSGADSGAATAVGDEAAVHRFVLGFQFRRHRPRLRRDCVCGARHGRLDEFPGHRPVRYRQPRSARDYHRHD